jgi:hypothetical protein
MLRLHEGKRIEGGNYGCLYEDTAKSVVANDRPD